MQHWLCYADLFCSWHECFLGELFDCRRGDKRSTKEWIIFFIASVIIVKRRTLTQMAEAISRTFFLPNRICAFPWGILHCVDHQAQKSGRYWRPLHLQDWGHKYDLHSQWLSQGYAPWWRKVLSRGLLFSHSEGVCHHYSFVCQHYLLFLSMMITIFCFSVLDSLCNILMINMHSW